MPTLKDQLVDIKILIREKNIYQQDVDRQNINKEITKKYEDWFIKFRCSEGFWVQELINAVESNTTSSYANIPYPELEEIINWHDYDPGTWTPIRNGRIKEIDDELKDYLKGHGFKFDIEPQTDTDVYPGPIEPEKDSNGFSTKTYGLIFKINYK